jgi:hypothetical protein
MKIFNYLILGLFLSISGIVQAQTLKSSGIRQIKPQFKANPNVCKDVLPISLQKGSVQEPNHQITNKVKYYVKDGKFYIKCVSPKPITENDFIWAQFPFKPGYTSGKITGMKMAYTIRTSPNNSPRKTYISQERIVQGPQPYQGVVRLDDPTNLYGNGSHASTAFGGGFQGGNNYKTVGFKLVMQPGDVIVINAISVLYDCPGEIITFMCPTSLPNPKIKLDGLQPSGDYVRYKIPVYNYNSFPNYLFSAAPSLPACGSNASASRSWIDIYDENNNRLYGFCALGQASDMKNIWFAVKKGTKPPARVRIVLKDRGCNRNYSSNWISIPAS